MELEIIKNLPNNGAKEIPLLFMHGANHNAHCWNEKFLPYFSSHGFPSYALSFRGHGNSSGRSELQNCTLSQYVLDAFTAMQNIGQKPILIGHSLGGAVIQKILYMQPEKVRAAVLISPVPPAGLLKDFLRLTFTRFNLIIQGALFDKGMSKKFPENLFLPKSLPEADRAKNIKFLQPESIKAKKDSFKRIVPKSFHTDVPILILGSKQDIMVSEKSIVNTGKFYKTEPVLFSDISHDMMLDPQWMKVAGRILSFLNEFVSYKNGV